MATVLRVALNRNDRAVEKVLDTTFDEYVDLAPGDELPDMAKVIVHEAPVTSSEEPCSSRPQEMPSHATEEVVSDTPNEVPSDATGDPSSWQGACLNVTAIELPSYSDDDGNSFTMPCFGSLHDVIVAGKRLESSAYRGIVDTLFAAMVKISVVPTSKFYTKVCAQLIKKYPELADVIGSGYDSWRASLRSKFKNLRRGLSDDARVAENKKKFGAQRKNDQSTATAADLHRNKKLKLDITVPPLAAGEDEASLGAHEAWLKNEVKKSRPDENQIKERMDLTASARLVDLTSMKMDDVMEKYPYLMDFDRLIKDFERLIKLNIMKKVAEGVDVIVMLATRMSISCPKQVMESLRKAACMDQHRLRTRHILALAATVIIGHNVKETRALSHLFVGEEEQDIPATPCVLYSGNDAEWADFLYLAVDRQRFLRVKNAEEGIAAIMAAYWLFNIKYSTKAANTVAVLERLFVGLSSTTPRPVVTKFLNKVARK